MSDRLDFIRAIRANPDDIATYLIYADWLEESGDEDDIQTALAIRCTYAKDQYFPKWDQRLVSPEDFAAFNQPMLLMERNSVTGYCLLGERGYEKYLHWRESRLLERRCPKPTDPERGEVIWTTNRWTAVHPLPVGVKGTVLWLMENLATLCYYYPITDVDAFMCSHPQPTTTDHNGAARWYFTNDPNTIRDEVTRFHSTAMLPALLLKFDHSDADKVAAKWQHNLTNRTGRRSSPLSREFKTRAEAQAYLKKRLLQFGQWAAERKV